LYSVRGGAELRWALSYIHTYKQDMYSTAQYTLLIHVLIY
jgi:hypothetical protein